MGKDNTENVTNIWYFFFLFREDPYILKNSQKNMSLQTTSRVLYWQT